MPVAVCESGPEKPALGIHVDSLEAAASKRGGSIISSFRRQLASVDKDGNKHLSPEEVLDLMEAMYRSEKQRKTWTLLSVALLVVLLLNVAATVGLTYVVIDKTKDTSVQGNTLVIRETGKPVQVLNADLTVDGGVLSGRDSSGRSSGTPLATADAAEYSDMSFNDFFTTPIVELTGMQYITVHAVRRGAKQGKLTDTLLRVESLSLQPPEISETGSPLLAARVLVVTPLGDLFIHNATGKVLYEGPAISVLEAKMNVTFVQPSMLVNTGFGRRLHQRNSNTGGTPTTLEASTGKITKNKVGVAESGVFSTSEPCCSTFAFAS
mmetsp:Transcript_34021/g.75419  ORF Transcript_34021/g.75419 Transcript_34021/m.75419 type:complete len:323 (+) Transcript_34021:157-1125(+)|eukprot:CAMPEP_0202896374 /NCGR_PEP_ID=MMETSP1392-20130828/5398_1 /ASSEMBLY_ACC=CAM_ASM_000868 /TAXON_ID=225041 /ORGANISM="Chlamydomonas chlamydogama, Strain SAG 11-48b" /LENGTH=322 /DNA_ID=CAMNT_0049581719 /DNA_START=90 /DNA_END=1058 /DNA_ORIENTATION=-